MYSINHKTVLYKIRSDEMGFGIGATLLDAIVLAVVSKEEEGTYGYKITQDVRRAIDISESTLYPVLRRLQKNEYQKLFQRFCESIAIEARVNPKLQRSMLPLRFRDNMTEFQ